MKEETGKTFVRGTIKPLVWEGPDLDGEFLAHHQFGWYKIYIIDRGHLLSRDGVVSGVFVTPEATKSVAQADYEARIAAQIQPDAEPIGWQTIETAPRDGAPFLAYDGSYVYECWFVNDPYDGSYLQDHADSEPNPTHWMPRPADPPRPIRAHPATRAEVSVVEAHRPPKAAVEALASYQQADADGCMVLVSRQAVEECLPALRALTEAGQ